MRRSSPRRSSEPSPTTLGACAGFSLLAIGLIYGQTLGHVLLDYDDSGFVSANPHVTGGSDRRGNRWAFTEGPYGEWYPLAPLSHMLDCQLFGLHAWGHHLTNVLLHAATSIALFLVLWRMTGELWPSAFVAAIFAVHPQHVESVAWVAERRDVLSGLFFMLTLGAYLGYVRHGRSLGRYVLTAVLFALGLMAKPMLVTLPPLLLLLDFWPLARFGFAGDTPRWTQTVERPGTLRLVLEKLPLVALTAGDCLMTLLDPRQRNRASSLVGADRQRGRFVRHLHRPVFLSRRSGGLLSQPGRRPAYLESGRRHRDSGRHQRRSGASGGGVVPTSLSAGSGIWAC